MDANFGLVRKSAAGTASADISSPRLGDGFFLPQEAVDIFVSTYDDKSTQKDDHAVSIVHQLKYFHYSCRN